MALSTAMIFADAAVSGGNMLSDAANQIITGGSGGVALLSAFHLISLRRDSKKSNSSFGWSDDK